MKVTRTSIFSGITRTLDLDVTQEGLDELESRQGRHIQDIFPFLSADDREFLKTGVTAEEWEDAFAEIDEGE